MSQFVRFGKPRPSKTGKTQEWDVSAAKDDPAAVDLGVVKWFGRWRCYAFFPEPNTVFETQCMRLLSAFCEDQTRAHRAARK